jgi:glycosyltransferase involved in cell wall biosynthesis
MTQRHDTATDKVLETSGVSVVICCYNSERRITETLKHLSKQNVDPSVCWEIILVDNASSDNTNTVAEGFWSTTNTTVDLRIVREGKPGLAYAREKGISEAKFNIIIFCDDDNWLSPSYIQKSFELAQHYSEFGAIGGEGIPVSDAERPNWFEAYKKYYACYPQSSHSGELLEPMSFLYGAGLIINRKNLMNLKSQGFESILSDRIGANLTSGGDNELCYALTLAGHKLYYSADLKFHHYIPASRLTKDYLLRLIKAISYSSMKLVLYHYAIRDNKVNRLSWFKDFLYRLYVLLIEVGKSLKEKDPFLRRLALSSSYNALKAVVDLYGDYRKIYKQLLRLKR